jgi:hypothetical protein
MMDITDQEIAKLIAEVRKHDEAAKQNAAPKITNFIRAGNDGKERVPRSMSDIIADVNICTGDWPRRIDSTLFVDDPEHGLAYFTRRTKAGLFGWLKRHHMVEWARGDSFVSQEELFAELERTSVRYDGIELLPHEPPVNNIYYRHAATGHGDGSHLKQLLARFRPETTADRDLIHAAVLTPFWGGPPGTRPMIVVTSDEGRGSGKTALAETIGRLCGGYVTVSANSDFTTLVTRLLSPNARGKRLVLLDNLKSMRFSWAELEALTTGTAVSGRQLYEGEGQRPNLLTWLITVNGPALGHDVSLRSIIIKIVKGDYEGNWWDLTCKFIDAHRQEIINDIITQLQAKVEPPPGFRFSRWTDWEQHVLCRLPDPVAAQQLYLERQGESNVEVEEAEILEDYFAHALAQRGHNPATCQQRIPVQLVAVWYGAALNRNEPVNVVSRKIQQMAEEGQIKHLRRDRTKDYGRCYIWTGAEAPLTGSMIRNDLILASQKRHP